LHNKLKVAQLLFDSGDVINSDKSAACAKGFVEAAWFFPAASVTLENPSALHSQNGRILKVAPESAAQTKESKTKPLTQAKSAPSTKPPLERPATEEPAIAAPTKTARPEIDPAQEDKAQDNYMEEDGEEEDLVPRSPARDEKDAASGAGAVVAAEPEVATGALAAAGPTDSGAKGAPPSSEPAPHPEQPKAAEAAAGVSV